MIYRFEDCELDIERRELRRDGVVRPIEPQVFNLLHWLIRNRHRVVSRSDLFQAVWNGRIVSDSVLGTRINAARKAIGDDGTRQALIRTLRRAGFRFVGTVRDDEVIEAVVGSNSAGRGSPRGSNDLSVRSRRPSLVVVSLASAADMTPAAPCKAIANDVADTLARGRSFDIFADNGARGDGDDPRAIASEFGARYVLLCAVRLANNQSRLTARLVDGRTGRHVWAQSYAYRRSAGLAEQDAIVANIAASTEPCLHAAEVSQSRLKPLEALDATCCVLMAFSVARSRSRQDYLTAQKLLARALELDPGCSRAHCLSAWIAGTEVINGWKPRQHAQSVALDAAQKAVLLDDQDPWAHFALGWALTQSRLPEGAIEEYRRALAIDRYFRHAYSCLGLALGYVGRIVEALRVLQDGERLCAAELLVGLNYSARAGVHFCAESCHDAIRAARRSVQQCPNLVASQRQLIVNLALAGEMDEARRAYDGFLQLMPNPSLETIAGGLPHVRDSDLNRTLDAFRRLGLS